jgi:hypothetical protein
MMAFQGFYKRIGLQCQRGSMPLVDGIAGVTSPHVPAWSLFFQGFTVIPKGRLGSGIGVLNAR